MDEYHLKSLDDIYDFLKKRHPMVYTREMICDEIKIQRHVFDDLIKKIIDDGYVKRYDSIGFGDSYSFNLSASPFDGYAFNYQKSKSKNELEDTKMWYDTENARLQYKNYPSTRRMAIIACAISIILLILELIKAIRQQH